MIQPHGGTLINKELPKIEKERILEQVDEFEKIQVDSETWKVIKNIVFICIYLFLQFHQFF